MTQGRRSLVPFVDGRSGAPRDALSQAIILASSADLAWPGIHVEYGHNGPWAVDDLGVTQHYLALNTDPEPLRFEVKGPSGFSEVVLPPGSVWFCPAGDSFTHRVPVPCSFALVTLDPGRVNRLLEERRATLRRSYGLVQPQIEHLLRVLVAEADRGGPSGLTFVEALGAALAIQIVDAFGARPPARAEPRGALPPARVRRVIELIEANLELGVSVEAMAAEVGLSPAHFTRAFKQATGRSPHQHLIAARLEQARAALTRSDARLSEVALRFGFADQAHFTRMFRRHFGITPGQLARRGAGRQGASSEERAPRPPTT